MRLYGLLPAIRVLGRVVTLVLVKVLIIFFNDYRELFPFKLDIFNLILLGLLCTEFLTAFLTIYFAVAKCLNY